MSSKLCFEVRFLSVSFKDSVLVLNDAAPLGMKALELPMLDRGPVILRLSPKRPPLVIVPKQSNAPLNVRNYNY